MKNKNTSTNRADNMDELVGWISDHEQVAEDFVSFFSPNAWFDDDDELCVENLSADEIKEWISEHEQLTEDYEAFFGEPLFPRED